MTWISSGSLTADLGQVAGRADGVASSRRRSRFAHLGVVGHHEHPSKSGRRGAQLGRRGEGCINSRDSGGGVFGEAAPSADSQLGPRRWRLRVELGGCSVDFPARRWRGRRRRRRVRTRRHRRRRRQGLGEPRDCAEPPTPPGARGAGTRPNLEHPLQPLFDEVGDDIGGSSFTSAPCSTSSACVRETRRQGRCETARARAQSPIAARHGPAWVAEPVGLCPSEGDGEVVDLVRRGEDAAGLRLRQGAAGRVGQVLLGDRGADGLGEAGQACVLGADVPFEIRKLAYELRRLIGLGEPGCLARRVSTAERLDQRLEAGDLVSVRCPAQRRT
jgi:hypothetical protein